MTGDCNEFLARYTPDSFADSQRTDFRNFPVHNRGKFVENGDWLVYAESSCNVDAHLLSLAQIAVGFEPIRWAGEADTAKHPSYLTGSKPLWKIVENALAFVLKTCNVHFSEESLGYAALARAAAAYNYAYLPIVAFSRQGTFEVFLELDIVQGEATDDALSAEAIRLGPAVNEIELQLIASQIQNFNLVAFSLQFLKLGFLVGFVFAFDDELIAFWNPI